MDSEKVSLLQCFKVLHTYDVFFVTHNSIDVNAYESLTGRKKFSILHFDQNYFKNIEGYNRLLLSYDFYKAFKQYKYILITQLDVFVFSDQLESFIQLNHDYIGAPWFEGYTRPISNKIIGVGNGGFSLRKVSSFLSIFHLCHLFRRPYINIYGIGEAIRNPYVFLRMLNYNLNGHKRNYPAIFPWGKYISPFPWDFKWNEDLYWSIMPQVFFKEYSVASIEEATAFCFEVNPRYLYECNGRKLPMATHAWEKFDPDFWMPFIEREGYVLNNAVQSK